MSALVDVLPYVLLFGIGISLVVAPLTTTLMGSVPVANAGPRVGDQQRDQPGRAAAAVGRDLRRGVGLVLRGGRRWPSRRSTRPIPAQRALVQPLNPPSADASPELVAASKEASVDALRLAAIVCGLLLAGRGGHERDRAAAEAGRGRDDRGDGARRAADAAGRRLSAAIPDPTDRASPATGTARPTTGSRTR